MHKAKTKTKVKSKIRGYTAIILRDGIAAGGDILLVISVPTAVFTREFEKAVTDMAAVQNQHVDFAELSSCQSLGKIRAIFEAMNPTDLIKLPPRPVTEESNYGPESDLSDDE